jgi:hypothetical protein
MNFRSFVVLAVMLVLSFVSFGAAAQGMSDELWRDSMYRSYYRGSMLYSPMRGAFHTLDQDRITFGKNDLASVLRSREGCISHYEEVGFCFGRTPLGNGLGPQHREGITTYRLDVIHRDNFGARGQMFIISRPLEFEKLFQ